MFAEGNGNYLTENKGKIVLGNASSLTNANIGIYSKMKIHLLKIVEVLTGGKKYNRTIWISNYNYKSF